MKELKKNHWHEMYELECLKTKELEDRINNLEGKLDSILEALSNQK